MRMKLLAISLTLSASVFAGSKKPLHLLRVIKEKTMKPSAMLNNNAKLVVEGTASLDEAEIVLLPEVHDDPDSLMTQLLLLAREQKRGRRFIVLDESLTSMRASSWELFSQKTLEVLAAVEARRARVKYSPGGFELNLKRLANKFKNMHGQLNFKYNLGVWTLKPFSRQAMPFYGWDNTRNKSLGARNLQMISSIKSALKNNDRVFVMLGARHVPELEYLTSQKILCQGSKSKNMDDFFNKMSSKYGSVPKLRHGIGSTTPIYKYLQTQSYALVYSKKLNKELDRVMATYLDGGPDKQCLDL